MRNGRRFEILWERPGGDGWSAYTSTNGDGPSVVLVGKLPSIPTHKMLNDETHKLNTTLSRFLVTHILVSAVYRCSTSEYKTKRIIGDIQRDTSQLALVWDGSELLEPYCPYYSGKNYLWRNSLLVHETLGNGLVVVSRPQDV